MKTSNLIHPFLILILVLLQSCGFDGKIDVRSVKGGCLNVSDAIFRDPYEIDTLGPVDQQYLNGLFKTNPKLKILYQNKDKYIQDSKPVFLLNTNAKKIISFTIRSTSNDEFKTTTTKVIRLNPGQELQIGCDTYLNEEADLVKQTFKVVGEVVDK